MSAGFGQDTWCVDSLQPGRVARGATLVAQALYRRLITPRGTLRGGDEESAYGVDVSAYVGSVGYPTAIQALPGLVRGELLKDDRITPNLDVVATITNSDDGAGAGLQVIRLEISAELADESGDFALTLDITNVDVSIFGGLP